VKLRTLERFEDVLAAEIAWRRKELTTLRTQAASSRAHAEPMVIRAGTALLYAHWEGFVKNAGQLYVEYVRQKKLRYDELSTAFLGLALKSRIEGLIEAKVSSVHFQFAETIRSEMSARAPLRPELVDTGANLSAERFKDIIERLGLDYTRYALREQLIDVRLLAARNAIAHGQAAEVELEEFMDLHRQVERLIQEFRQDILTAAQMAGYRM
jgi:hypothetical protein